VKLEADSNLEYNLERT